MNWPIEVISSSIQIVPKMSKLKKIWSSRKQILEGITNSVFKKEDVEVIAAEREKICATCEHLDLEGSSCLVSGTQPCCGQCGCSLKFKLRSLSSDCGDEENPRWKALLSQEEEDAFNQTLDDA